MRLLIVDDSSIVRSRIARLMGAGGLGGMAIVGMAKNGVEALNLLVQTKPDVITMDLTMPEMDGVQCTEAMMKLNPEARILVVSALADKATAIKALQKGAQGFLYKPFTDEQLASALGELMAEA
jgi:two-component system chemotaxis response regulator CheY